MNRLLASAGLAVLVMSGLAGCAGVPTQEMSDARQALQAARAAGADTHAAESYGAAEQRLSRAERELAARYYGKARHDAVAARREAIGARNIALALAAAKAAIAEAESEDAVSPPTRAAFDRAAAAAAALDEIAAVEAAADARAHAEEDIRRAREARRVAERENRIWLDKAAPLLHEARAGEARMTPAQRDGLRAAEAAERAGDGRGAHELALMLVTELRAAPVPPPQPSDYRVRRGDTLWGIAARREVYGNPEWWPLIYRSNQPQLADPDLLTPGQSLQIEAAPSAAAAARAVEHARQRGAWSLGTAEASDRAYLHDAR